MNMRLNLFKSKNGKALAYGSLTIEEQICVSNISLYQYDNKKTKKKDAFLTFPSYQTSNGDYKNYVFPITAELREVLNEGAKRLYKEMLKNKETKGMIEFSEEDLKNVKKTNKKSSKKALLEDEDLEPIEDDEEVEF